MDRTHLFLSVLLILAAFDTASVSALTATTEPMENPGADDPCGQG